MTTINNKNTIKYTIKAFFEKSFTSIINLLSLNEKEYELDFYYSDKNARTKIKLVGMVIPERRYCIVTIKNLVSGINVRRYYCLDTNVINDINIDIFKNDAIFTIFKRDIRFLAVTVLPIYHAYKNITSTNKKGNLVIEFRNANANKYANGISIYFNSSSHRKTFIATKPSKNITKPYVSYLDNNIRTNNHFSVLLLNIICKDLIEANEDHGSKDFPEKVLSLYFSSLNTQFNESSMSVAFYKVIQNQLKYYASNNNKEPLFGNDLYVPVKTSNEKIIEKDKPVIETPIQYSLSTEYVKKDIQDVDLNIEDILKVDLINKSIKLVLPSNISHVKLTQKDLDKLNEVLSIKFKD